MKKISIKHLNLWQFEHLGNEPAINHFITDRKSAPAEKEFTLSYSSSPNKDEIENNRNALAGAMSIPGSQLHLPSQVHKTKIVLVTHNTQASDLLETDALITNQKGICIAVMSADCVTILLYDKRNGAIGAVHSGWRGTVSKILEKTIQQMNRHFGTTGKDLIAGIGPSICQDSYEVGEEVVQAVSDSFGAASGLMIPQGNNKAKLDLWKANALQLWQADVPSSQIEISNLCTVKNNLHFFSARKGDSGRFAAGIMLM